VHVRSATAIISWCNADVRNGGAPVRTGAPTWDRCMGALTLVLVNWLIQRRFHAGCGGLYGFCKLLS
jgi:hypothetical protein